MYITRKKIEKVLFVLCLYNVFSIILERINTKSNDSNGAMISDEAIFPLTIVSSYFGINRKSKAYIEWLKETTKLNAPFIFYTQNKFKHKIEDIFNSNKKLNYEVITIELEDLDCYQDIETVKDILNSTDYKTKMENHFRIESADPLYIILQHVKLTLLVKSVHFKKTLYKKNCYK